MLDCSGMFIMDVGENIQIILSRLYLKDFIFNLEIYFDIKTHVAIK